MKAFRCDRCGKFYSYPSSERAISQNAMDVMDSYGNEKHILIGDWSGKRIDLCMDCSVDLKYWWGEGQAVKEEE